MKVVKPKGGPVVDELKDLIDADLKNPSFRKTFFQLIQNDPTFLMTKVHDGNYGIYGDGASYRKRILELKDTDVSHSVQEIEEFKAGNDGSLTPEITTALSMAMDSFNLNFSAYMSVEEGLHLLGDSRAMDMMLKAKFSDKKLEVAADKGISESVAFSLMEHTIPNSAFIGKKFEDIVRFRNHTAVQRDRFKERVLELTVDLQDLAGAEKHKKVDELIYKVLVPELRLFQERQAKNWDNFFSESMKSVLHSAKDISTQVAQTLPLSIMAGLVAAAAQMGVTVMPHLIDYLAAKKEVERTNPYAYLMKFSK
jgi:hypothetical protein